jgi:hypothetical protein
MLWKLRYDFGGRFELAKISPQGDALRQAGRQAVAKSDDAICSGLAQDA